MLTQTALIRSPNLLADGAGHTFSVRCLLMGANHGAIQHQILIVRIVCQILKDALPDARFGPTGKAFVHGFVLAVPLWQIVPMGARANNPKNSIHKQSIISTRAARI